MGLEALTQRTIFIAGGGSGMGAELARQASVAGAKVALAGRSKEKLTSVASTLPGPVTIHPLDISQRDQVEAAFRELERVDHIVSTVADLTFKPFIELTDGEIERTLASKIWASIQLGRAAHRFLNEDGSLLFYSGVAAYRPVPGGSMVSAANHWLEGMMNALAVELKPRRVNIVSPGIVDSPTWDGMSNEDKQAMFTDTADSLPVGRVGNVQELAEAGLSILTNGYIDAQVLHVDGGGRIA
ncbi:SDR family oxidoreductase [Salinicola rhizosphaerae]|uniref:Short chain dehydrogenase n=1 Tax=Salinicola rhizosphaerae TaxID=1443141 RepID=A0ABQ3DWF0_9GAMM|nr:SDR family oxidoreductase [Salinicola rhizosphaerae]GHB14332.1 short chain dehydrogenase [Salinicola rhizosphaerae]